jgi:hypothetical protein
LQFSVSGFQFPVASFQFGCHWAVARDPVSSASLLNRHTGNWKLATGNWQLATGYWQLVTGNWEETSVSARL